MLDFSALQRRFALLPHDPRAELAARAAHAAFNLLLNAGATGERRADAHSRPVRSAFGYLVLAVLAQRSSVDPRVTTALTRDLAALADRHGFGDVDLNDRAQNLPEADQLRPIGASLRKVLRLSLNRCEPELAGTFATLARMLGVTMISHRLAPLDLARHAAAAELGLPAYDVEATGAEITHVPSGRPPEDARGWAVAGVALHLGVTRVEVERLLAIVRDRCPESEIEPDFAVVADGPLSGTWTLQWSAPVHGHPAAVIANDRVDGAPLHVLYDPDAEDVVDVRPALVTPRAFDRDVLAALVYPGREADAIGDALDRVWQQLDVGDGLDFARAEGDGWTAECEAVEPGRAVARVHVDGMDLRIRYDASGVLRIAPAAS